MIRAQMFAVVVTLVGTIPCSAQMGGGGIRTRPAEKWNVEVKMADGQTFEGVLSLDGLEVEGDFGSFAIKSEKIKEARFMENQSTPIATVGGIQVRGTIVTVMGAEFSGNINFPGEGIVTDLGVLRPNPLKVRTLIFKGKKE